MAIDVDIDMDIDIDIYLYVSQNDQIVHLLYINYTSKGKLESHIKYFYNHRVRVFNLCMLTCMYQFI